MRRPGILARSLNPPSAYAARQTGIWDEITDRIAGALTPEMLADVGGWLLLHDLQIPTMWEEPITEMMEKRAAEIEAEEIGQILRERFDFT
jgi:hypothetical protein